ncbi:hypothetical protein R9C00_28300 [Flammeovirgaceae bacterium SG7u.111]|nr:hypothetical protein [Flammeovirgaceae bacterium SG7u.132]WPO35603.1 hypothetical protein R9C00_28300 [Flammeovirgaceae bacterium SG7u.111]
MEQATFCPEYAYQVLHTMPSHNRSNISRKEVLFILAKLNEYYAKASENEINETAFLNEPQYIHQELSRKGLLYPINTVKAVLKAEAINYAWIATSQPYEAYSQFPF